jgi:hypothetical protein
VEPAAATCLVRLFLRYIVEVESLPTKGFTKLQMQCYVRTLQVRFHALHLSFFLFCNQCNFGAFLDVFFFWSRRPFKRSCYQVFRN